MLNKIKIGPKLIGGFVLVAMVALCIGVFGMMNISTIEKADTMLYEKMTVPISYLLDVSVSFQRVRINIRDMVNATEIKEIEEHANAITALSQTITDRMEAYEKLIINDEMRRMYNQFVNTRTVFRGHLQRIIDLAKQNKDDEAYELINGDARHSAFAEQEAIDKMVEAKVADAKNTSEDNTKTANTASTLMITVIIFSFILSILIGYFLTVSITKPLEKSVTMIQEMGKGHLGMRLNMNREDEIGTMAKTMDTFADDLQNNVVQTMQKIAAGDVSVEIEQKDNQDEISPALHKTVDSLKNLISETKMLATQAVEGNLTVRGKADNFKGAYQEIIYGFNSTLDAILTPINESSSVLEKIAARDLTARVQGDYKGDHAKMKNAVNTAAENLDTALTQVTEATEQVSSASQQISAGSQSLAQGANEQASSLEEVSSSLEEMSSMTKQNADNAGQAKALASEADKNAQTGAESMREMSSAINRIKESSDQTAKIVKTIDEIAMQTNLLALNAAVEAARAGEAGRGFAVVAEEVRNLAQRSAQAAKNTADMISESVKNADSGVQIAEEVSKSFELIAVSSKKVNDLIAEIAAASQEQSQGIDQVNTAVAQMDKVTQQNAANSEESASAAEELSSQAEELQSMVAQFSLTLAKSQQKLQSPVIQSRHAAAITSHQKTAHNVKNGTKKNGKKSSINLNEAIPLDEEVLKEF